MSISLIDLIILDKETGKKHKVGTSRDDSLYTDEFGNIHYFNLETKEECMAGVQDEDSRYEFVKHSYVDYFKD